MYWNNPLISLHWPNSQDPIQQSMHGGRHCLFWNPNAEFNKVVTNQRLVDLCRWAMNNFKVQGHRNFISDPKNHYDIANLVKLNMWIHDIKAQGIIKPWMFLDQGDGTFLAGTGDSRLRCLERIPSITTVPGFISTTVDRQHLYQGLERIETFDRFAELCKAQPGQMFLFRLTDHQAPYGIYWYEYDSEYTRSVTPGQDQAVEMFDQYLHRHPNVEIVPEWFDQLIDWQLYSVCPVVDL